MQKVWAYFCRCHFVGSCPGTPCEIINPVGVQVATTTNYFHIVSGAINLDGVMVHVDQHIHGDRYEKAKKYYGPDLKVSDPGFLGVLYITSESKDFTIQDVIKKFEFEPLDSYFRRSIDKNAQGRGSEFLVKLRDQT